MDFDLFSQPELPRQMHSNSIEAYREKVLPTLSGRKLEVLNAIKELGGKADMWEIGQYLNRALNTFSGRISELKKMGLIEDTNENKKHHESNFTIWRIL